MRYALITTTQTTGFDANDNPVTLPANTVVNVILWDGIAPYHPGPHLRLEQSDTLQVGDTAP